MRRPPLLGQLGGAVAAVQLTRLAGSATLYTTFGDDERGRGAVDGLLTAARGEVLMAAVTLGPRRRSVVRLTLGFESNAPKSERGQ